MSKLFLTFALAISYAHCFGQIETIVVRADNNNPIPFVNIWALDHSYGTTSGPDGNFSFDNFEKTDSVRLMFSAIGYETREVLWNIDSDTIRLHHKSIDLKEITISRDTSRISTMIDAFDKNNVFMYSTTSEKPLIIAKYFPYKPIYQETPFINRLFIVTKSSVKNAKFNLRLYRADNDSSPGDYLFDKNIFGYAKRKKDLTEIDLSSQGIRIPKSGLFVAVEWLIIDANASANNKLMDEETGDISFGTAYQPIFGMLPCETDCNSWVYEMGKWRRTGTHNFRKPNLKYFKKYNQLAITMTLSNF
jgi:hypothetical protein